jgi:Cu(I)/Ag(I) efflux system membrane protein CusA/SilA
MENSLIHRVIVVALQHRRAVLLIAALLAVWGVVSLQRMSLDAIPDLSDLQVIVKTPYPGQTPQRVEDQITYPLSAALLSVPGSTVLRGVSMFGESYVYVLFAEGTDPYWARSRVLEQLTQAQASLPAGVMPTLGPDASGVGWVFEYALVDRSQRLDPDQLRALQDFFLKYELQSVAGVAEVASVGGSVRQFQVEVDPSRLAAYNVTLSQVQEAVRDANVAAGGSIVEMGRSEFVVAFNGYLRGLEDFAGVPVAKTAVGSTVHLGDVAHVQVGPAPRRGVADLNGDGEVTGGIVIMRYGHNALTTIAAVKRRLQEVQRSLPEGVEVVVTYDRSGVITRAVSTLTTKLLEEGLAVAAVCLLFLFHLRSALVAVISLPLGILMAFIVMHQQGINANIMSLGGIAVAIGAMVDAAVVMIENMHKHLEKVGSDPDYWAVAQRAALETGPALFFSLLIITVSFLPVVMLSGQEGKLFAPLAYTKTYAMAAAAGLAVTLIPVLMGGFIRGELRHEAGNPVNRLLQRLYRPVLQLAMQHRIATLLIVVLLSVSALWPLWRAGSEFMPPLDEGDVLYMPTMMPGVSIDEAANILQISDRLIARIPEVERVFGKAGRADTATDPAPLSMLETTVMLKPQSHWAPGVTLDDIVKRLNAAVHLPGLTNSWGFPIRTRIDMLSTGVRTPLGIKVSGPRLDEVVALASSVEATLRDVAGTRNVFADRLTGGHYIDIQIDRAAAANYGVAMSEVQELIAGALGGENIATVIAGRERYAVSVRYAREFRGSLDALREARVISSSGAHVALGKIADVRIIDGPSEIKSENGQLVAYVYVDVADVDMGSYVRAAQAELDENLALKPGYRLRWSGQYESMARAQQRLAWVIPGTVAMVVLLLYMHFGNTARVALVLLTLPFALAGGAWLVYALGYHWSVAVAVGFVALAGVAAEFGVVMLLYLDAAVAARRRASSSFDVTALHAAVVEGALLRLRPKAMTVAVILAGLLPVMLSQATGTDVMKRIAAPLLGGMITAPLLSLIVVPVLYTLWQEKVLQHAVRYRSAGGATATV